MGAAAPQPANLSDTLASLAGGNVQRAFGYPSAAAARENPYGPSAQYNAGEGGLGSSGRPGSASGMWAQQQQLQQQQLQLQLQQHQHQQIQQQQQQWGAYSNTLARTAASRVRGYSPGPGKQRGGGGKGGQQLQQQQQQQQLNSLAAHLPDAGLGGSWGPSSSLGRPGSASRGVGEQGAAYAAPSYPPAMRGSASPIATPKALSQQQQQQQQHMGGGVLQLPQYQLFTPSRAAPSPQRPTSAPVYGASAGPSGDPAGQSAAAAALLATYGPNAVRQYQTQQQAAMRTSLGSSMGGFAAFTAALAGQHPAQQQRPGSALASSMRVPGVGLGGGAALGASASALGGSSSLLLARPRSAAAASTPSRAKDSWPMAGSLTPMSLLQQPVTRQASAAAQHASSVRLSQGGR